MSSVDGAPKIEIRGATKTYETKTGPVHALESLSVDIPEGELVCILGPSGCGKTTLLWALGGLHALTRGQILVDNEPVRGPRPQVMGFIFQDANLLPWRNLRQNIEFPFEIKRRPVDGPRIETLLARDGPRRLRDGLPARAFGRHAAAGFDRAQRSRTILPSCSWTSRSARSTPSPATR